MPKRLSVGLDPQRLSLLLAVLHRHGGVETAGYDVFVNAVGGVRINEPAADLAILLAVNSSLDGTSRCRRRRSSSAKSGSAGEIRPVQRGQERIRKPPSWASGEVLIPNLNKPQSGH